MIKKSEYLNLNVELHGHQRVTTRPAQIAVRNTG
jgi:hypothetical protein